MSNLLQAALDYAGRGFPVFPCNALKEPICTNGVLDATTDIEQIKRWWTSTPKANIGCAVGEMGMMVLDYDPGHSREELHGNVGLVPATQLRQRTPRGGTHEWYLLAEGEVVSPSSSKLAPKVDVRSFNSYVLLAPSRTADGEYHWESEGTAAYRTDEMVRVANSHRDKSEDRDHWSITPDLPENVADAIAWLKKDARIAVEGNGGDAMAYATAAHLKSFGISQALAFDLIWEHWNPRCSPPWGADEVEHLETKVMNGYSYNTSPPGNITNAYRVAKQVALFAPVAKPIPSGKEFSAGRYRIVDRDGMQHIRPPEWLIPDLLPQRSHAILFGAPGTFKTFIALDLALSIATGCAFPWGGCWPDVVEAGPVLFAVGEGREQVTKRVQAWEQTYWGGRKVDNFILIDPTPSITEPLEDFISAAELLRPKYKLVVIDTVGRAMAGTNENSQEHASAYSQMVAAIQRSLDCAVLSLAHEGHGNQERERGSSVFAADADVRLRLVRPDRSYAVRMEMKKQKDAEEWSQARLIELKEVQLPKKDGKEIKSLVAAPITAGATRAITGASTTNAPANENDRKPLSPQDLMMSGQIDRAIGLVLAAFPVRKFFVGELAQILASRDEIDIGSELIKSRFMTRIRETKGTIAARCYDPLTKRYSWVAPLKKSAAE